MTTDVGDGRRGRRAGKQRRTSRAAIAAGALAAASIPLWPSSAGASHTDWPPYAEHNAATHTVVVGGVPCQVTVSGYRLGEIAAAKTDGDFEQTPHCATFYVYVQVEYVTPKGDKGYASTYGPQVSEVSAGPAADLTRSVHRFGFTGSCDGRPICEREFTLNYPK